MVRYWAIAPYWHRNQRDFRQIWQYDRDNGVITIGWPVGQPLSREDLARKYAEVAAKTGEDWGPHGLRMLTKFWFDIQPGDRIIARGGRKIIVGVGTVQGEPFYVPDKMWEMFGDLSDGAGAYENFLPVEWDDVPEKEFADNVFIMYTIQELPEDQFKELTGEI